MIYFIYPEEESIEFLFEIVQVFGDKFGHDQYGIIKIYANEESYEEAINQVKMLPKGTTFVFLGHGHPNQLYGVFNDSNNKLVWVEGNKIDVFNNKRLLAVACDSAVLLGKTFHHTSIIAAIGFGDMPTEEVEIRQNKNKYKGLDITVKDLTQFKQVIVRVISKSLIAMHKNDADFDFLNSYLRLLINKEMAESVLVNKNRVLSDLIFRMCDQIVSLK